MALHGDLIARSALARSPTSRGIVRFLDPFGEKPRRAGEGGDLEPEHACFIPAAISPTGEDLVVTCNELRGATTIRRVRRRG
ncbi:MAG: hypothetical protein FJ253_10585 [Phycisphaerae bacterium]|nr:hypothetical protein [Phycisphaerae bacterium]